MTRIVSWNVNGVRAAFKKGLLNFLSRESPDVLCLQEIKATPEQVSAQDLAALDKLGYRAH